MRRSAQAEWAPGLQRVLTWLSPAFPVGAFAYSHGLEWAVEAGDVRDRVTLGDWLLDLIQHGGGRSDVILLRHACRADHDLDEMSALALAAQPGRERREETMGQGAAFAIAGQVWGGDGVARAYPVAFGALARINGIDEDVAALGFLHAFAANLISAALRLIPLGQTDGLRTLAGLEAAIGAVARETRSATLDEIGGACFRSDIAAMRHETQYTRLFRT